MYTHLICNVWRVSSVTDSLYGADRVCNDYDVSYTFINRELLAFRDTRHVHKLCQQPFPRDSKDLYSATAARPIRELPYSKAYNIIVI